MSTIEEEWDKVIADRHDGKPFLVPDLFGNLVDFTAIVERWNPHNWFGFDINVHHWHDFHSVVEEHLLNLLRAPHEEIIRVYCYRDVLFFTLNNEAFFWSQYIRVPDEKFRTWGLVVRNYLENFYEEYTNHRKLFGGHHEPR